MTEAGREARMAAWAREAKRDSPAVRDPTLIESHAQVLPVRPTWGPAATDVDSFVAGLDAH